MTAAVVDFVRLIAGAEALGSQLDADSLDPAQLKLQLRYLQVITGCIILCHAIVEVGPASLFRSL